MAIINPDTFFDAADSIDTRELSVSRFASALREKASTGKLYIFFNSYTEPDTKYFKTLGKAISTQNPYFI